MNSRIESALLTGALVWCAAILAAPLFPLSPVYAFFSAICHQAQERSWALAGQPLPVCIRCTAIYTGFLFSLLFSRRLNLPLLQAALATTLVAVLFEMLLVESVLLRTSTGLLLGYAAAPFVRIGLVQMFGVKRNAV